MCPLCPFFAYAWWTSRSNISAPLLTLFSLSAARHMFAVSVLFLNLWLQNSRSTWLPLHFLSWCYTDFIVVLYCFILFFFCLPFLCWLLYTELFCSILNGAANARSGARWSWWYAGILTCCWIVLVFCFGFCILWLFL